MTRRSTYGAVVQTAQLLDIGLPEEFTKNSTLNTTLNIQPDAMPNTGEQPRLRYFVIGIGAATYREGVHGIPLPSTKSHIVSDAGLFRGLPFCIRDVDNPLDEVTAARYALRRIESINGVNKVVYWARRINVEGAVISASDIEVTNGRITASNPFMPGASNREPVPTDNSNVVTNPLTAKAQRVSCPITVVLDAFDVAEILNAAVELYGSEDYSHISEIGMVTGVDRMVQAQSGSGGSINFNEVIAAQVHTFLPTQVALKDRRTGLELKYDVASSEWLYINGE